MALKPGWKRRALIMLAVLAIATLAMRPELVHLATLADATLLDGLLLAFEAQLLLGAALLWRRGLQPLLAPLQRWVLLPLLRETRDLLDYLPTLRRFLHRVEYVGVALASPFERYLHLRLRVALDRCIEPR